MRLIGFDFGASSGRAIIGEYDGGRLSISEIHRFGNEPVLMGRHLRLDFPRLLYELKNGLRKASGAGNPRAASIGVNTWGVDFGLLDRYGELMYNPFFYRDDLTEGEMEKLRETAPDEELYRRTGVQFMRFNTIYQLCAIKRQYPEILENTTKLLFLPDLFGYFLTGAAVAEYSIASTSALLDAERRDWDRELMRTAGIDPYIFPDITMPGTPLGALLPQVAEETGAYGAEVISVCGHDTAGAVLAAPISGDGRGLYLSCGTWSLLGVELAEPLTRGGAFEAQYTNEGGYNGSIRFLKNIMGQWMANEIKREYERANGPIGFKELDALERQAEPFVSLVDVDAPEFAQPGRMADKVAAFCERTGQKKPDGLGAMIRCVDESIALSYRYNVDALEGILGYGLPEMRAVGGGVKNVNLMKMAAGALGRPVRTGPEEASATGNILAQLIALGEIKDVSEARRIVKVSFDERVYEPAADESSRWDEAFYRFNTQVRGK